MKNLALYLVAFGVINLGTISQAKTLTCHGAEPFWGATLSDTSIELDLTGEISSHPIEKVSPAAGFAPSFVSVYSDARGPVAVTITRKCDNGMSEEIFAKEIVIFTGLTTLYGCCD